MPPDEGLALYDAAMAAEVDGPLVEIVVPATAVGARLTSARSTTAIAAILIFIVLPLGSALSIYFSIPKVRSLRRAVRLCGAARAERRMRVKVGVHQSLGHSACTHLSSLHMAPTLQRNHSRGAGSATSPSGSSIKVCPM